MGVRGAEIGGLYPGGGGRGGVSIYSKTAGKKKSCGNLNGCREDRGGDLKKSDPLSTSPSRL